MPELIDKDKLKIAICIACSNGVIEIEGCASDDCTLQRLIDDQPTIEAEPVRHGLWIPVEDALPEKAGNYLCTLYYAIPPYHLLHPENDTYIREVSIQYFDGKSFIASVVAWQPMPDAYEPPESEVQND